MKERGEEMTINKLIEMLEQLREKGCGDEGIPIVVANLVERYIKLHPANSLKEKA
jgi:hypothetical protein